MIDHSKLTITIINSNIEFDFLHHKNPYFIYIFIYFWTLIDFKCNINNKHYIICYLY